MPKDTRKKGAVHFAQEDDVCDAMEALIDVGLRKHFDEKADETLTECRVCNEWEGHTDDCPMPRLLAIMNPGV